MTKPELAQRQITGDRPKEELNDDRLGYADFARSLAASLDGSVDAGGLVLAIHGEWGSGKTSAVNMALRALQERQHERPAENQAIIVRFNPWWFSEQVDLTRAFFSELTVALGRQMSARVKEGFARMAKRVGNATDFISWVVKFTPAAALADPAAAALKALVGDADTEDKTLAELRAELEAALRDEQRSVVVVMDDIDRLPADEARQLFRLVKSLADLPFVTYLLVFDRNIAERSMEKPGDPEGPEWIEKIVQASFDLPPIISEDLHRMMFEGLDKIPGLADAVDQERWPEVFNAAVSPWLRTPRTVERLVNMIGVGWPPLAGDIDAADFVAIETIRLFEPKLYNTVRRLGARLCGRGGGAGNSDKKLAEELLSTVDEDRHKRAKRALSALFPRLKAAWSNYYESNPMTWDRQRRLASARHFDSYFRFGVGRGALSRRELDQFEALFDDADAASKFLGELVTQTRPGGGNRALILLDEWQSIADDRISEARAERSAKAFLQLGDQFFTADNADASAFAVPLLWRLLFVLEPLLMAIAPKKRAKILLSAARESSALHTISGVVLHERPRHGPPESDQSKPEEEWLLTDEQLDALEAVLRERLREVADAGDLHQLGTDRTLVFHWRSLVGVDEAREWAKRSMETSIGAGYVIRAISTFSHYATPKRSWKALSVDRKFADDWVDLQRLTEIARSIAADAESPDRELAGDFVSALDGSEKDKI